MRKKGVNCWGSRTAFTFLTLINIGCVLVFFSRSATTVAFTVFPTDWRVIWIDFLKQLEEELLHIVKKCITHLTKCQRHLVFPGGHPSKYWPDPTLLNFADRTRSGAFNVVWSLTCSSWILPDFVAAMADFSYIFLECKSSCLLHQTALPRSSSHITEICSTILTSITTDQ